MSATCKQFIIQEKLFEIAFEVDTFKIFIRNLEKKKKKLIKLTLNEFEFVILLLNRKLSFNGN